MGHAGWRDCHQIVLRDGFALRRYTQHRRSGACCVYLRRAKESQRWDAAATLVLTGTGRPAVVRANAEAPVRAR